MILEIIKIVRDGWKSINVEQKICLAGIAIGTFSIIYAFSIDKYRMYIGISGYILTMLCSIGYGLFKYFPILKKSKRKIPQKTISYYTE